METVAPTDSISKPRLTWPAFSGLVVADLYRYNGETGLAAFLRAWRHEGGFRLTLFMRLCRLLRDQPLTRFGLYHLVAFLYRRMNVRYGVYIDFTTRIDGGLFVPHACNIIINRLCVIGRNCNLSQGITLGVANRGTRKGVPVIGDQVYLGPGSVIFGSIHVGSRAAVGANCVVTKDVPESGVAVGVPGKVISQDGSDGYVTLLLPGTELGTPPAQAES